MTPSKRTVKVIVDGKEIEPPEGTKVVPVLVSDELYDSSFDPGMVLSGCGARAYFEEMKSGFATVTLVSGNKAAH